MAIIENWEFEGDGQAKSDRGEVDYHPSLRPNGVAVYARIGGNNGGASTHVLDIPISVLREILRRIDEGDSDEVKPDTVKPWFPVGLNANSECLRCGEFWNDADHEHVCGKVKP